ncbi:mitochondrial carrier domain-containing protein [Thelonectria olida]|uniref:Mitochondrial carrier domain-containing protein n=1 Tax=Thelonectria olida TaxID=1576542 RepID=A0A9P8W4P7_9HYPO|nr:mitochondrial carrier domain-containing protein [Thelonectria olida]
MIEIYAAGAIAAFTVDLLVYPLDTLKTRYQSQDYVKTYVSSSTQKVPVLRGLYQGVGSVILATLPAAGLFFSTYEYAKRVIGTTGLPAPLMHSSASALAELASCLVLAPAEVIKQNAQMIRTEKGRPGEKASPSTSVRAFRQLGGAGASRRLFTGYSALVARNLPFTALQFPIFEHVRARVWEYRDRRGAADGSSAGRGISTRNLLETGLVTGCSAGGAGAVAAFITTPSDVVKTRMMLSAGSQEQNQVSAEMQGKQANKRAWAVAREVYVERGAWGFFRGAALRSGWTMLGSGLYLGTYEMAKEWLNGRHEDVDDVEM